VRGLAVFLAAALLVTGCGHVTVVTNDKQAAIYADGRLVGRGEAELEGRTGFPRTMTVKVKSNGTTVERKVKRRFTATTFVIGIFTYMTGWLWGWQYPENVVILLPEGGESGGGWDEARSPWDVAPSGWDAPQGAEPKGAKP
jgi:hypothetical protein